MGLLWEKLRRYRRYAAALRRHASGRKLRNFFRVECRRLGNNPDVRGLFPYTAVVDISNTCNLRCPLCAMGRREIIPRPNRMSLENYAAAVSPFQDYLFLVCLYNWGEPFFNRDIYRIIRWNTAANIATFVSSNLNLPIDAEELVRSGLEQLVISGDGITQEVYEKYRVGGSLARVLQNLAAIVEAKRRLHARLPYVEWQCLVNRHNEGQLAEVRRTVLNLGADEVRFANINFFSAPDAAAQQEWLPQNPAYRAFAAAGSANRRKGAVRRPCPWLWRTAVVNSDGGIVPCCLFDVHDWGNVLSQPFSAIWSNELFDEARRRSQKTGGLWKRELVCDNCPAPFLYR
jgi:MoaA/NifB/PqqE/SkfB family radical SAM enzyme